MPALNFCTLRDRDRLRFCKLLMKVPSKSRVHPDEFPLRAASGIETMLIVNDVAALRNLVSIILNQHMRMLIN